MEKVWENTVDGGLYRCWVERTGAYTGILMVERDGETIFRQEVGLAYQALFGPDIEDVGTWERLCIAAIDEDYAKRGETPPQPEPPGSTSESG